MSEVWVIVLEVLLLAGLVALAIRKKKNCTQQYDEMQLRVRGTGYKIGFLTALVMMGLVALLAECGLLGVVTPGLASAETASFAFRTSSYISRCLGLNFPFAG